MINEKTIKQIRKICIQKTAVTPAQVCGMLDFLPNTRCESSSIPSIYSSEQVTIATKISGANDRSAALTAFDKMPDAETVITFCPSEWSWANALPFKFTREDKILLACSYGLASAKARELIFSHVHVLGQVDSWIPFLKEFHSNAELQLTTFVDYLISLKKELTPKDDLIVTFLAKQKGIKGKVVGGIPESVAVYKSIEMYESIISEQVREEVTLAKKEGTHQSVF